MRERDIVAQRGELREDAGEVELAGAFAGGLVDGERGVRAVAEDRFHEAGENRLRADFDERVDAGGVHALDRAGEVDRPGELAGEEGSQAAVPDPFGGTPEAYQRTYRRLEELILAGLGRLAEILGVAAKDAAPLLDTGAIDRSPGT